MHNKECFSSYMGLWCIDPMWIQQALASIQSGLWKPEMRFANGAKTVQDDVGNILIANAHGPSAGSSKPFDVIGKKIAAISIDGPMMKAESKFGGTSTLDVRKQIRSAAKDGDIESILLMIDSPGGHVSGTAELAEDIRRASEQKFVHAHIEDLGASAAFWAASQASRISMNKMGQAGNIGTVAVVHDTSKSFEQDGIKVHVISTGDFKGAFTPGSEVTDEHLADLQEKVDTFNQHFLADVKSGRGFTDTGLKAVSDGRTFIGESAVTAGLIDEVANLDDIVDGLMSSSSRSGSRRSSIAASLIDLERSMD